MHPSVNYPKPSPIGGTLIRKVMAQFKAHAFPLPIHRPILIGTSGGVDSMVLAHLVCRYGRKVVDPSWVTLLHFDHQWRKESGTLEKKSVQKLATQLGVKFRSIQLDVPPKGLNAEEHARNQRITEYECMAGEGRAYAWVMTAHHQDDLAETILWRFLRGEFFEQTSGILFKDDSVLRPLLKVSKEELYAYAKSEKVPFHEDPTNHTGEGMRSYLRKELIPELKKRFPSLLVTLAEYPSKATPSQSTFAPEVEAVLGQKLNRAQRAKIEIFCQSLGQKTSIGKQLSLPGGAVLEVRKDGFLIKILDRVDSRIPISKRS